MSKFFELNLFWIVALASAIISYYFHFGFPSDSGIKEAILSASISWAALTAGFFATILATLLSGGGGKVVIALARAKKSDRLWNLLFFGIIFSILFGAISMLLYFLNLTYSQALFQIWIFAFSATLILFVLIACILVQLLRAVYT